jgi:20S proteasome subunit alpha 5
MIKYKAKGIGAADEGIQSILNEKYNENMSLEDAKKLALHSLK